MAYAVLANLTVAAHLGFAGSEPILTVGLLGLTALFSLRPYLAWAAA